MNNGVSDMRCVVCGAMHGIAFENVAVDGVGRGYWEILCRGCYEWSRTGILLGKD
jgi:hypothetical protein